MLTLKFDRRNYYETLKVTDQSYNHVSNLEFQKKIEVSAVAGL